MVERFWMYKSGKKMDEGNQTRKREKSAKEKGSKGEDDLGRRENRYEVSGNGSVGYRKL